MRFPSPFGQPKAGGPPPKKPCKFIAHELNLRNAVVLGQQLQDGLIEASTYQLQLASRGQCLDEVQICIQMISFDEFQEWPRRVERNLDTWELGQRLEERQVGTVDSLPEYVIEVADGLVIMDAQAQPLDIMPPGAEVRSPWRGV